MYTLPCVRYIRGYTLGHIPCMTTIALLYFAPDLVMVPIRETTVLQYLKHAPLLLPVLVTVPALEWEVAGFARNV